MEVWAYVIVSAVGLATTLAFLVSAVSGAYEIEHDFEYETALKDLERSEEPSEFYDAIYLLEAHSNDEMRNLIEEVRDKIARGTMSIEEGKTSILTLDEFGVGGPLIEEDNDRENSVITWGITSYVLAACWGVLGAKVAEA